VIAKGHIVALGGGGFLMEESPVLDAYVLALAQKERPRICFLATAMGDSEDYIVRFYQRFASCSIATHLPLFRRKIADLDAFAREQDIFYVSGGNTANMLAIWAQHGFDRVLSNASMAGKILAGVSAGSICWFEEGITDSFGPELAPIRALGLLKGSNCPHYDGETARRPAYQNAIAAGMAPGIACDDGVAVHYAGGELRRVIASRKGAKAYRVELVDGKVTETALEAEMS
jgi:peptidase E